MPSVTVTHRVGRKVVSEKRYADVTPAQANAMERVLGADFAGKHQVHHVRRNRDGQVSHSTYSAGVVSASVEIDYRQAVEEVAA